MTKINAEVAPHSWSVSTWPPNVYPGSTDRARYLIRAHHAELFAAGVLSRPGRELVVIGARYVRWLEGKVARVADFSTGAARSRTLRAVANADAAPPDLRERETTPLHK